MPEIVIRVKEALVGAVNDLREPDNLRRARDYLYGKHALHVHNRNLKDLNSEQRLIKAALDVAYHGNVPEYLEVAAAYAGYNEPYEIASMPILAKAQARGVPAKLPVLYLEMPRKLRDLLEIRPAARIGEPELANLRKKTDAIASSKEWWQLKRSQLQRWGKISSRMFIDRRSIEAFERATGLCLETVRFAGVHVARRETLEGTPGEFCVMFLQQTEPELSPNDLHATVVAASSATSLNVIK